MAVADAIAPERTIELPPRPVNLDARFLSDAIAKMRQAHEFQSARVIGGRQNLWIVTLAICTPGAHTVIYGPPGTAKSMAFDGMFKHLPEMRVFKTPAFKGSPPEQFLGSISIKRMAEEDEYVRNVRGKFPWAEYAFVDELLRAPRAVLPVFQTGMSDGVMDNGFGMEPIPLITFMGATNALVDAGDDDLQAFWDRIVFKPLQYAVQAQDALMEIFDGFLARRAEGDHMHRSDAPEDLLLSREEIYTIMHASANMPVDRDLISALAELRSNLLNKGIAPSIRRINALLAAIQTDALLRGQDIATMDNMQLAKESLWTDIDEREAVEDAVLEFASDFEKGTAKLSGEYDPMRAELVKMQADYAQVGGVSGVTKDMNDAALRLLRNHNVLRPRIEAHMGDAKGRDVSKLVSIVEEMDSARAWVRDKILAGLDIG